jgi:hypothetical protein
MATEEVFKTEVHFPARSPQELVHPEKSCGKQIHPRDCSRAAERRGRAVTMGQTMVTRKPWGPCNEEKPTPDKP